MSLTYEVRRSLAGQDDWTVVASDLSEPTLRDTGLTVDTAYDYQVRACNAGGCSEWSASVTVTPLDIRYDVRQSLAGQDDWTVIATDLTETEYLVEGLEPNTGYDFQVRACYGGACSAWSDIATETTNEALTTLAVRGGIEVGGRVALTKRTGTTLAVRGGIEIGGRVRFHVTRKLRVRGGIEIGGRAGLTNTSVKQLAIRGGLEIGGRVAFKVTKHLSVRGGVVVGGRVAFKITRRLRIRGGIIIGSRIRYMGPGTGIVVAGGRLTTAEMLALAEEGDTFLALLPWGGIEGRAGTLQILSRTVTDQGARPQFQFAFDPLSDPDDVPAQRGGGRVRYRPPERSDPYRAQKRRRRD